MYPIIKTELFSKVKNIRHETKILITFFEETLFLPDQNVGRRTLELNPHYLIMHIVIYWI